MTADENRFRSASTLASPLILGAFLCAAMVGTVGCGDDGGGGGGSSNTGASGTGGGDTGGAGTGASGGAGTGATGTGGEGNVPTCDPGPGYGEAPALQTINTVTGHVEDLDGNPVADISAQLCGLDICLYGTTNASGDVAIPGMNSMIDHPKFKIGDGKLYGRFAYPVDNVPDVVTNGVIPAMTDSGVNFSAGATIEHAGVTIELADPIDIDVDILTYTEEAEQTFKVGVVPANKIEDIAPGRDFGTLVAFGPADTLFCPAAKLTVPNTSDFAPGAAVEFWVHGLSIVEEWAQYGEWGLVSGGVVSDDGMTITTNDGEGIPELVAVGVRLAN